MRFTIEARGEGLTYQWQVSTDGGGYWGSSTAGGYNTDSMSVPLTEKRIGYLYRCKVTDANGNVVYSEPGEIQVGHVRWDFTYDANGLRTKRTNGTTTYDYIYNGGQLTKMTVGGHMLNFAYDVDGKPAYLVYDGTKYFYLTNLQGDVVAIADRNGNVLVQYTYDAWGNILTTTGSMATTLGKYNPLRYRGYVYDQESALYYLQSRYYDPALGRFINADAYPSTGQGPTGNNMFAYCLNNPVNGCDPCGTCFHRWDFWNDCEECKTNGLSGLTFSFGLSGSVGVGPYLVGGQISITLDSEGYGAVQYGYFGGASVGPETASFSGSVSPFAMITNAPSFRNLEGSGIQIGTAIPPYSIDYVGALDETGQEILYDGIALGGMTTSSDVHVFASYTYTWFSAELDWDAYRWATQY